MTWLPLFIISLTALASANNPVVEISDGKLRGDIRKDLNGNDFYSFRSVPYARPPLGQNRFKDPKPVDQWKGIRDALEDMPICFQKQWDGFFHGSEDCLYLNVHTPKVESESLKAVMVFIHGGGFTEGTGRHDLYGPEFLMIEDIVLVTINYRLGVFGFMNFENPDVDVPGNAALKDQLMALKWVKKNIHHFGGDPEKVTIFGESAGGASVHLHVLSPMSQGYFHRAIAMSGTALPAWCNGLQNSGLIMSKHLGYQGGDEFEMLKVLQEASFDQLTIMLKNSTVLIPLDVPNVFGPTIEQRNKNAFLPDTPRNLIKKGDFKKVPLMIGYTNKEGMFVDVLHFAKFGKYDPLPTSKYIPYFFDVPAQREGLENELRSFYFSKGHSVEDSINLATDGYLSWAIYDTIFGHLKNHNDVYFYLFSSDSKLNRLKLTHPVTAKYAGACHMDDLGYLFTSEEGWDVGKNSIEDKSIRLTTKLFANFARYGYPTNNDFQVRWEKTNLNTLNAIEIVNDRIEVRYAPDKERAVFWSNMFKKYKPELEMFYDWSKVKEEL